MLGYEQISLGENEFITQWKTIATEEERNRFIAEHARAATDGGTLNISGQAYSEEEFAGLVFLPAEDMEPENAGEWQLIQCHSPVSYPANALRKPYNAFLPV